MCKHAETFLANNDFKLAIAVFTETQLFPKQKFEVHFSNFTGTKTRLHTPNFCMKMYHFSNVFHMTRDK